MITFLKKIHTLEKILIEKLKSLPAVTPIFRLQLCLLQCLCLSSQPCAWEVWQL